MPPSRSCLIPVEVSFPDSARQRAASMFSRGLGGRTVYPLVIAVISRRDLGAGGGYSWGGTGPGYLRKWRSLPRRGRRRRPCDKLQK